MAFKTIEDIQKELEKIKQNSIQPIVRDNEDVGTGMMDSNALTDFAGNFVWGGLETLMVPTVLDIASEVREEGLLGSKDISADFGSQDWKDESWAGRTGYILGTAGGMLTGFGLVGKALGSIGTLTTKLAPTVLNTALKKQASEEIATLIGSKGYKDVVQSQIDDIITQGNKTIAEATETTLSAAKGFAVKRAIKASPTSVRPIKEVVSKNINLNLAKITGNQKMANELTEEVLKTVVKYGPGQLEKELALKFAGTAIGSRLGAEKTGQVLAAMGHEALTVGTFLPIGGKSGGDTGTDVGLMEKIKGLQVGRGIIDSLIQSETSDVLKYKPDFTGSLETSSPSSAGGIDKLVAVDPASNDKIMEYLLTKMISSPVYRGTD